MIGFNLFVILDQNWNSVINDKGSGNAVVFPLETKHVYLLLCKTMFKYMFLKLDQIDIERYTRSSQRLFENFEWIWIAIFMLLIFVI